jgi:molybdate transport system ATP-binding protein
MTASPSPVLSVACAVRFGTFTLDVDFTADAGITVLLGHSGAGKTTVLNLVAGLHRPDRGRIEANGDVLVDTESGKFVPPHRRRVGVVFQDAQLFPHLTVDQNLSFGRWFARGRPESVPRDQVVACLGLQDLLSRRPSRLSGGEKQRVSLGRALLSSPRLLLMDEPLAGLDEARREEILPLIERVRDEFAVPILYVTHAREEARRLAGKVLVLERGRVTACGPPAAILT